MQVKSSTNESTDITPELALIAAQICSQGSMPGAHQRPELAEGLARGKISMHHRVNTSANVPHLVLHVQTRDHRSPHNRDHRDHRPIGPQIMLELNHTRLGLEIAGQGDSWDNASADITHKVI